MILNDAPVWSFMCCRLYLRRKSNKAKVPWYSWLFSHHRSQFWILKADSSAPYCTNLNILTSAKFLFPTQRHHPPSALIRAVVSYFTFLRQWLWRLLSPGMWRRVVWWFRPVRRQLRITRGLTYQKAVIFTLRNLLIYARWMGHYVCCKGTAKEQCTWRGFP
jgi:hypothetical protein